MFVTYNIISNSTSQLAYTVTILLNIMLFTSLQNYKGSLKSLSRDGLYICCIGTHAHDRQETPLSF